MHGRDESDPLFLQVKEAEASVLSRYCGASHEFERMRGPYLIAEGITAYREHVGLHHRRQVIPEPGQPMSDVHGG